MTYEHLPTFCPHCRSFKHSAASCRSKPAPKQPIQAPPPPPPPSPSNPLPKDPLPPNPFPPSEAGSGDAGAVEGTKLAEPDYNSDKAPRSSEPSDCHSFVPESDFVRDGNDTDDQVSSLDENEFQVFISKKQRRARNKATLASKSPESRQLPNSGTLPTHPAGGRQSARLQATEAAKGQPAQQTRGPNQKLSHQKVGLGPSLP